MTKRPKLEAFGLDDPEVLEQATHLAPELFAALAIARSLDSATFPITSDDGIEKALAAAANSGDRFATPGVTITPKKARDSFPNEFLPVRNRVDFVKKVYLAIVIDHKAAAQREIDQLDKAQMKLRASHPIPKEFE
ncbi:MAG: hypothetical protein ABJE95_14705 [Byssovorax sp.]